MWEFDDRADDCSLKSNLFGNGKIVMCNLRTKFFCDDQCKLYCGFKEYRYRKRIILFFVGFYSITSYKSSLANATFFYKSKIKFLL